MKSFDGHFVRATYVRKTGTILVDVPIYSFIRCWDLHMDPETGFGIATLWIENLYFDVLDPFVVAIIPNDERIHSGLEMPSFSAILDPERREDLRGG